MLVVAGLSLKNLHPRVWDADSPYYLPGLQAVMVSYAEFHRMPTQRAKAMEQGLRCWLGVPQAVRIFLDNGAFSLWRTGHELPTAEYEAFVRATRPDWYPIPRDFIPAPSMSHAAQQHCVTSTLTMNSRFATQGYTPVAHVGACLNQYLVWFVRQTWLHEVTSIALGGIVPNLLRAPAALPYRKVLDGVRDARNVFAGKQLHLFGIGGTATLHLAALLGIDSVDSSGWRNRAARGIVQLPGRGDRAVAALGKWRGREPSAAEWKLLKNCDCPACQRGGIVGLQAGKLAGFCHRATHNLWTLLREAQEIDERIAAGTYLGWYGNHIDNSIYRTLIDYVVAARWPTDDTGQVDL